MVVGAQRLIRQKTQWPLVQSAEKIELNVLSVFVNLFFLSGAVAALILPKQLEGPAGYLQAANTLVSEAMKSCLVLCDVNKNGLEDQKEGLCMDACFVGRVKAHYLQTGRVSPTDSPIAAQQHNQIVKQAVGIPVLTVSQRHGS